MYIIVLVTAKDLQEANNIATHLVEKKLVACANIIKDVESIFWWEGKIDKSDEVLMIFKTQKNLFKELKDEVKKLHSYTVPEIISFSIEDGNEDYLSWIANSTKAV